MHSLSVEAEAVELLLLQQVPPLAPAQPPREDSVQGLVRGQVPWPTQADLRSLISKSILSILTSPKTNYPPVVTSGSTSTGQKLTYLEVSSHDYLKLSLLMTYRLFRCLD